MKKSKQIALCSMLAALSLTLMFLGSIIWAFTYIAPLVSSLIMVIICDTAGKRSAFITYLAVSIIALFFLPDKECALTYVFFFGYYVIIKGSIERIKPKALSYFVKLLIYNIGIITSQLLLVYAFRIPFEGFWGIWGIVILILVSNFVFVAYEIMLNKVLILYECKYKSKIHKLLK